MKKIHIALAAVMFFALVLAGPVSARAQGHDRDLIQTSAGDLEIVFLGHASLMLTFQGKVVHVDPWSKYADYAVLPKADLILITHDHGDHLDPKAVAAVRTGKTELVLAAACADKLSGGKVLTNGQETTAAGFGIEAVPAYNLVHERSPGQPYHPRGRGNGYVVAFGDKRVYIAGDTENTPEMKALKDIDVAFLPMNLPYTMTPEMVADAAKGFKPKILYPYHYGRTDTAELKELMKGIPEVEVRIKRIYPQGG